MGSESLGEMLQRAPLWRTQQEEICEKAVHPGHCWPPDRGLPGLCEKYATVPGASHRCYFRHGSPAGLSERVCILGANTRMCV